MSGGVQLEFYVPRTTSEVFTSLPANMPQWDKKAMCGFRYDIFLFYYSPVFSVFTVFLFCPVGAFNTNAVLSATCEKRFTPEFTMTVGAFLNFRRMTLDTGIGIAYC